MIAVLTDLRRPTHLAATLDGIDSSATSERRIVIVDGNQAPEVPSRWEVVIAPKPAHSRPTENRWSTWRAFELASQAGEDLLFLEDDVIGCPGAARRAEEFSVPDDCAMVMFYVPWGDSTLPWRLWRIHASQFSFCQALKVPLRTCRALCDARTEMEACRTPGSDECIREIGAARDWLVGVHCPGLYQHVGRESLVSGERHLSGSRVSRAWITDHPASMLDRPPFRDCFR